MAKDIMVTVVQSAVTATLIGLAIAGMKRQKYKEAMTLQSGAKMMRAPTSMWLLSYGSLLFWIALIVLSSMFPGKTKDLFPVHMTFGFFAVLSVMLIYCCHVFDIVWDEGQISGPTWYGKRITIRTNEITKAEFNEGMQSITVTDKNGRTIWIPEYWSGVAQFMREFGIQRKSFDFHE